MLRCAGGRTLLPDMPGNLMWTELCRIMKSPADHDQITLDTIDQKMSQVLYTTRNKIYVITTQTQMPSTNPLAQPGFSLASHAEWLS